MSAFDTALPLANSPERIFFSKPLPLFDRGAHFAASPRVLNTSQTAPLHPGASFYDWP